MCGIWGHIGKIEPSFAEKCLNTLSHRGPDGSFIWQTLEATLGHRRLAILDLSDKGRQPMSYADERYWLTFNGEIYNFLEIKKELIQLGHSFKSESDSEVILAAFSQWKEQCLNRFNGMWAFAIWDQKEKSLFLSRDRFGKKPLYYTQTSKGLTFGSEMKAVAPVLDSLTPDEKILNDFKNIFYYESTDRCLIKEIKRFPAGHYGYYQNGRLTLSRYWNTLDNLVEVPANYDQQVEKFRELFMDACKIRMRADVPIGTALSGGLDSSSVAAMVSYLARQKNDERMAKNWHHAFSASFPNTPLDESADAQKVASHLKINLELIKVDPGQMLKDFERYLYLFEDIYLTPPLPFVAVYGAMRQQGVIVTLDGHAADELFGGYSFDYLHILHDNLFNWKKSKSVIDTYYQSYLQDGQQFKNLPPKAMFWSKQLAKNLAKKLLHHINHSPDDQHPNWPKLDYFTQKLYISSHQTVLPTLLRNYDRYSMINGVEIRMPFLDHRIVSYAFSLPWTAKIRNGFTKNIVRDALAPYLPQEIVYRRTKIGFNAPMVDWFKGPLKNFFLDTIKNSDFKNSSLFDSQTAAEKVTKVINDPRATFDDSVQAWLAVSPYFWQKSFLQTIKK